MAFSLAKYTSRSTEDGPEIFDSYTFLDLGKDSAPDEGVEKFILVNPQVLRPKVLRVVHHFVP